MSLHSLFTDYARESLAPLEQDIIRGEQVKAALAIAQQRRLEEAQAQIAHASVEGLGQLECRISPEVYFRMAHIHGQECWTDDGFLADMRRKNPGMFNVRRAPRRVTLTMPGLAGSAENRAA